MRKLKVTHVLLDEQLIEQLESLSILTGKDETELLNRAVEEFVNQWLKYHWDFNVQRTL